MTAGLRPYDCASLRRRASPYDYGGGGQELREGGEGETKD